MGLAYRGWPEPRFGGRQLHSFRWSIPRVVYGTSRAPGRSSLIYNMGLWPRSSKLACTDLYRLNVWSKGLAGGTKKNCHVQFALA